MGVYIPYTRLPSTYQEVEYIESSGTQYIDAGLPPSNNTKVQFRLSNYSINSSIQYVFGSTSRWGNNMFGLLGTTGRSGDTINGHLLYNTSEYKLSSGDIGDGGAHVGELSSNGFYVDGTRIGAVSGVFSGTLNMTIFAGNINGIIGENERGAFKLYYFKVYESGTLVRDFVPCYRKSDNVIGLYDLVNNQFYTNSGTGTFSKGADVTAIPLKNAYIGEVYEYSYDFRNKSSTILTNDGWTVTGSPTFNSNGMSGNGPSVSRSLPTRNTANKITLTHTFDVRRGGSSLFRIGTMSNGSLTNVSGSYTLQGSYRRITIANSATNYNGVNNGTYTLVMTLDLVNDTWEVTTTGLSTQTGTITSTQKATILANINNILADTYSSNGGYLQSLSVRIE